MTTVSDYSVAFLLTLATIQLMHSHSCVSCTILRIKTDVTFQNFKSFVSVKLNLQCSKRFWKLVVHNCGGRSIPTFHTEWISVTLFVQYSRRFEYCKSSGASIISRGKISPRLNMMEKKAKRGAGGGCPKYSCHNASSEFKVLPRRNGETILPSPCPVPACCSRLFFRDV